ncbi:MAG: DEAD/DEAH box helicase family protein [Bacteroidota bacterium]
MIILKEYQEKAVERLIEFTCEALVMPNRRIQMLLKAPTGAGKTVTMAAYLSRLLQEVVLRPDLPRDLAFIWFAPNTLHLQSYASLKGFYSELNELKPLQLDDLGGNTVLQPKDLLFVNWSSVDKEKNTFRKENEKGFNLETLIENTNLQGTEIIVVIDEAHLSAFTGEQAKKVLKLIDAKIEISVTATPPTIPDMNYIVPRQKVVEAQMIKKGVKLNSDLSEEEQKGEMLDLHLLRKAMQKRNQIAEAYQHVVANINPLLLIQLPSETAALTEEDKSKRQIMENYLAGEFGITIQNHQLAVWLSDSKDKVNLESIEDPDALQKVLIFKQAISQGWDCPRAAVLIIFREIGNPTFGVQTVGRILRMPQQKHYENEYLDFGYVYTNIQNKVIQVVADDLDYFSMQVARRKPGLVYNQLNASFIVNDRPNPGYLLSDFEKIFYSFAENQYGITQVPEHTLFTPEEDAEMKNVADRNRQAFIEKMWDLNVDEIEIAIPTNLIADAYEVNTMIDARDHMGHFSKTQAELSDMLDRFCYESITRLNKSKSWKVLRRTLIQFVEYYLSFDEFTARKILLCSQNQQRVIELITTALEHYETWQKERGNQHKRVVDTIWQIPEERYYSEVYKKQEEVEWHVLEPFYEYKSVSSPEKAFSELLEKNDQYIDWWYKNGDKGKENFSIFYTNAAGDLSLFYVDFIIRFKNGTTGLFDTKTKRSDSEAPQKHNALIAYIEKEKNSNPDAKFVGGIVIPESTGNVVSFRFCSNQITDTNDLTGWEFFDPATIN